MPKVTARYDYVNSQDELLYQVERLEPKGFRARRPVENNEWAYNLDGQKRVLYRLPAVIEAVAKGDSVYVTEGEKDADTLVAAGKCATTAPGGAGKPFDEYASTLRGANVIVVADADEPGRKHALAVCNRLDGTAKQVWLVEPREPHKDVTEHLAAELTLLQLKRIDWERRLAEGGQQTLRLEVMSAAEIMKLPGPKEENMLLGPLLYQGHRVVLGGHTGHGKSTMTMHMIAAAVRARRFLDWEGRGDLRALVIDVEQGVSSVQRCLREVGLDDSEVVHYLRVPDGLSLDSDKHAVSQMERVLRNGGYSIVLADPLYKLHRGDPNDSRAAVDLMRRFDEWRERFQFALILPMHCRKPHPNSTLSAHDLFGSASYQWGAEVLMGVERKPSGNCTLLHFWKDREGLLPPVDTKWRLCYDRESGYHKLDDAAPRFDLPDFLHQAIKAHDGLTRDDMRGLLWSDRRAVTMPQIDRALAKLTGNGVTHDGARLLKDRVYRTPNQLIPADDAAIEHEGVRAA